MIAAHWIYAIVQLVGDMYIKIINAIVIQPPSIITLLELQIETIVKWQ